MSLTPAPFPPRLLAAGVAADGSTFQDVLAAADLPPGTMRRVSIGDLDVLIAHTDRGLFAVDDRCPHMAAPLSIGELDGCIVACPLHEGRFDLASGDPAQMPTTGGIDPDGVSHPTWSPAGRLTRVRRFRYYPVRVRDDRIGIALPPGAGGPPVPHLHLDGGVDHG